MYRILDLDNCIADDAWRIKHINWQQRNPFRRYHDYHSLSPFDELRNEDLLSTNEEIVVLTGRSNHYRAMTIEWLSRKGVRHSMLMMRNDDDGRRSNELKATQLQWLLSFYGVKLEQITSAFDDRPEVIEAYKSAGIQRATVRAIHAVKAYLPPTELLI